MFDQGNNIELGEFCGRSLPSPVTARSGAMRVQFYSDFVNGLRGFNAVFRDISGT